MLQYLYTNTFAEPFCEVCLGTKDLKWYNLVLVPNNNTANCTVFFNNLCCLIHFGGHGANTEISASGDI